jgi:hypothetical protein
MVGIDPKSSEGRWFAAAGGSTLVAAALTAEVGGTTALGSGLTLGGVALGIGSTAGVGLALLVGGLIGTGLDYGIGALDVCARNKDCSLSGWLSDKMVGW